ncbi:MAG: ABC transporter substrate-binding protein [Ferruginibacter sp.]
MLKTGFLLPRSTIYPVIGYDFLDGFKSYFNTGDAGNLPGIITHNIGFGIDEAEVYSKNEELLLKDNVDVVIAFMDSRSAEMIQPLFAATGKILLLVNMGAHYSFDSTPGDCTINHTFNVAFNSWLTGKLAADENHKRALFATSYYDAGYLQCFAMATRYLAEAGNTIVHNYVSHFKKNLFSISSIEEYLATDPQTNTVLGLFSGDVSPLLYKEISRLQQTRELHFYVSPMMLEESLRPQPGHELPLKNIKGYTAWNSQLPNQANQVFMNEFARFSGRTPGIFSLLGWETAAILYEIEKLREAGTRGVNLVKEVLAMKLESPRGWLRFDADTHQSYSPAYLLSVSDNFSIAIQDTLEETTEERTKFTRSKPVGESSGWRNTYLCS